MIPFTVLATNFANGNMAKSYTRNSESEEWFNTIDLLLNLGHVARRTKVD
jgi:hypothetical protein